MSKIIAIGDTHGKSFWKLIAEQEKDFNKFVFIGDYWDSFDISYNYQKENFAEILDFKRANMNKVVLLFGNHDFHYLDCVMKQGEQYSGFQSRVAKLIQYDIQQALDEKLMQMCFRIEDKYLFTHAGVTNTWLKNYRLSTNPENVDGFINELFIAKPLAFRFQPNRISDHYGDDVCHSPIWVRPQSFVTDYLSPYIHIVGHTKVKSGIKAEEGRESHVIFIDTFDNAEPDYLVIENDKFIVKKVL